MAHFAQLDDNNAVTQVIVVSNAELLDANGVESEERGAAFCRSLFGGKWVQTSYSGQFRGTYAGIGHLYDKAQDTFVAPDAPAPAPGPEPSPPPPPPSPNGTITVDPVITGNVTITGN